MKIEFVGAGELTAFMRQEQVELIDLRDASAYRKRHIRGARSLPYELFLAEYSNLPKKKLYILYCDRGATSILATASMQNAGYRVRSLAGGIQAVYEYQLEKGKNN